MHEACTFTTALTTTVFSEYFKSGLGDFVKKQNKLREVVRLHGAKVVQRPIYLRQSFTRLE